MVPAHCWCQGTPGRRVISWRRSVLLVPALRKGFIRINKCATSSVTQALKVYDLRGGRPQDIHPKHFDYVIALWRAPSDRLESAWRYLRFQYRKALGSGVFPGLHGVPNLDLPFGEWVSAIKEIPDRERDPHVCSQNEYLWQFRVPIKVIRWDFDELSREFDIKSFPKSNQSQAQRPEWGDQTTKDCRDLYEDDWRVWEETDTFYGPYQSSEDCPSPMNYRPING